MKSARPWPLPQRPTRRSQLLALGVSLPMVRTQVASGQLLRLHHGIYLASAAWPSDPARQHLLRAEAAALAQPGSVLSHASAAVAWGLPHPGLRAWHEGPVELTISGEGGRRSAPDLVVHRRLLPAHHVATDPDGRPVTSLARTAADLAAGRPLPEALVILDAGLRGLVDSMVTSPRRRDFSEPRLADAARGLVRRAWPPRTRAELAALALADPARETPIESLSFAHFHLAGLPAPVCQAAIATPVGTLYPDFYWEQSRLVGEADGAVKYSDRAAILREKEREQVLRDLGFRIVRWLGGEILGRPEVVVDRVGRALGGGRLDEGW